MESSILKNMYLMSWTDALRVHDRLLKVAFHFSSKRLRDVTEGEQAIAVDACGPKDASPAVEHYWLKICSSNKFLTFIIPDH